MFEIDRAILVGAVLLLLAIVSSSFSSRLGLPVLVLFLALGMLAGSEGLLGIPFEDYELSHAAGTVALALILFDGGLRTSMQVVRQALGPALVLATVGVGITAAVTGAVAAWALGIPALEGMLLGSIVGSTDAAAVFAVLRARGVNLSRKLAATLELESGSNDPMAVFLTVGLLEVLLGRRDLGVGLLGLFAVQMTVGLLIGWGVGAGALHAARRFSLAAEGLYPVATAATALLAYGAAAAVGGSGFLSVYVAGIVVGNGALPLRGSVLRFHDATAWVAQIIMFVLLGLLSFPSRLQQVAGHGLLIAAALTLLARPLAVGLLLPLFRFSAREVVFVSWVGLKGAVPIVLAMYPLLLGLPDRAVIFDVVFFVVLVSALTQGWSLPWLARRLGLQEPPRPEPGVTLELSSAGPMLGAQVVQYAVTASTPCADRFVRDLGFPQEAVLALVVRGQQVVPPRGSTQLLPGDHVYVVVQPSARALVDRAFGVTGPADADG